MLIEKLDSLIFRYLQSLWSRFFLQVCCYIEFCIHRHKTCLRFSKLYFQLEIMFCSSWCHFCSTFSNKKYFYWHYFQKVESESHFNREAVKVKCGRALKENYITDRMWGSAKLFVLRNDTTIVDITMCL